MRRKLLYFSVCEILSIIYNSIVIRYKVYSEQHPRAGLNIQHVIYEQLARAGRNM